MDLPTPDTAFRKPCGRNNRHQALASRIRSKQWHPTPSPPQHVLKVDDPIGGLREEVDLGIFSSLIGLESLQMVKPKAGKKIDGKVVEKIRQQKRRLEAKNSV